jgi:prepilin-type N-terminal cleavage/methylation domain-containing protein
MKSIDEKGMTLFELLVVVMILGLISVAVTAYFSSVINAHAGGNKRSALYREGLLAMERMTAGARRCTYLLIPNAHRPVRDILAFSGSINDDNDYFFGDLLFPKIDEDPRKAMTSGEQSGIIGVDDDGDGDTDEGERNDDDEDGREDEDWLDGLDNDGDGNIDEDTGDDADIEGMDDDADGDIDEGHPLNDDEDDAVNEDPLNPVVYSRDSGTQSLLESYPDSGDTKGLSTHVTFFQVTYKAPERILIELTLTGDDGETVQFVEYVYPRNTFQKTGKRVR